jgi:hypothetical protein
MIQKSKNSLQKRREKIFFLMNILRWFLPTNSTMKALKNLSVFTAELDILTSSMRLLWELTLSVPSTIKSSEKTSLSFQRQSLQNP